jgi:hypothetical protein
MNPDNHQTKEPPNRTALVVASPKLASVATTQPKEAGLLEEQELLHIGKSTNIDSVEVHAAR